MRKRLLKQVGFCLLIACALFISKNSHIGILEKGAETVMNQMEVNYTADDAMGALKKGAVAVAAVPDKFEDAVSAVTGKPIYGEPIDDKYSGNRASVFAVENGEVTALGENETIGKYIRITHGDDGESLYGNLASTFVEVPERVKRGQIIGTYEKSEEKEFYYSFKEFN